MNDTFCRSVERLLEFWWCRLAEAVEASIKSTEVDLIERLGQRDPLQEEKEPYAFMRLRAAARSRLMDRRLALRTLSLVPFLSTVTRWRFASLNLRKCIDGQVCWIRTSISRINSPPRRTSSFSCWPHRRSFFGSTNSWISSSKAWKPASSASSSPISSGAFRPLFSCSKPLQQPLVRPRTAMMEAVSERGSMVVVDGYRFCLRSPAATDVLWRDCRDVVYNAGRGCHALLILLSSTIVFWITSRLIHIAKPACSLGLDHMTPALVPEATNK